MLCLEVTVNGGRWCRAGIGEFGSMDAAVTWVGVEGGSDPPTTLSVTGLPHGAPALHWRDITRRLVPGDVVEVRLVEGDPDAATVTPGLPPLAWPREPGEE
jgi:hypothetical protein